MSDSRKNDPKSIFRTFLNNRDINDKPGDIYYVLRQVEPFMRITKLKKEEIYDIPVAFDIETTSFYYNGEKCAIMYEWTLGICGLCVCGRTWDDLMEVISVIRNRLGLTVKRRLIVYVHNLAFEFQFIRKYFNFVKVFAIENRKPIYAITDQGIEFRCSYLLSGYSLATLAGNLKEYEIKKLVGDLDYDLIRHDKTPLSPQEWDYCLNDAKIVCAYIMELIEKYGSLAKLPITKTGFVRKYCRGECLANPAYRWEMRALTLEADEYLQLKRAFQGGFTHANPFYSGRIVDDVTSYDFTSSYPYVMVSEQFPMTAGEIVEIESDEDLEKQLKYYCCLFDIEIENLQSVLYYDNYLSISRCWDVEKPVTNNGRVVSAVRLRTTVTETDYKIMRKFYKWDHIRIANFRRYRKGYLPTEFVRAILNLYRDKTTLKGVQGKEDEYMNAKEMLNSCYGMAVTDIVRDDIVYQDGEWRDPVRQNVAKEIQKYNRGNGRFLFYPWGVWVTAYARRNLFTGICEFAGDYVYSDTDSVKVRNVEKHMDYITKYNDQVVKKLQIAMQYHGLPFDLCHPRTVKGVEKMIGVWDFDGKYQHFKTLGAKRYMVQYDTGEINITVSGLNKQVCVPYIVDQARKRGISPFDLFDGNMYIPPGYTGKMTHTYIDEPMQGEIADYQGEIRPFYARTGVHLEKADYSLSIAHEYAEYIKGVHEISI